MAVLGNEQNVLAVTAADRAYYSLLAPLTLLWFTHPLALASPIHSLTDSTHPLGSPPGLLPGPPRRQTSFAESV